jgi:tRNA dimethylallyltransferase
MLVYMKDRLIQRTCMLIIYGPTAVGKTDLALAIADNIPAEIINMDVGQFYTPLSIGTAKPDWKNSPISHHLFDIIDAPGNYTVAQYRAILYKKVSEVLSRGNLPILVGGSGFYLHSLLFLASENRQNVSEADISAIYPEGTDLWQQLYTIDPERALRIDKNDQYRIQRALTIWHATGKLPSAYSSLYCPQADYLLLFVERDREELKKRINMRVGQMLHQGWIAETEALAGTDWQKFIEQKNLIGYAEIFAYLASKKTDSDFSDMVERISAQTRQYAKRQFTFWRKLEREIKKENQYTNDYVGCLEKVDLTNRDIHLYMSDLLKRLPLLGKKYE